MNVSSSTRRARVRWAPGVAVLAAILGGLTACGPAAPAAAPTTSAPPTATLTPVTLVQGTESLLYAPIYVAPGNGYFRDDGLDVEVIVASGGGSQALTAVFGGSGQVASAAFSNNVEAALKGKPLTAFAALMNQYANNLVMRKDVAARKGLTADSSLAERSRR